MKIAVIGTGYVGLVTGACLSEMGNHVHCVDQDRLKIAALKQGEILIHEPGLADMVQRNLGNGRLAFTTDLAFAIHAADVIFIAVGTPQNDDGSADISHVLEAAHHIGRQLASNAVIVVKSTVPAGTTEKVDAIVRADLKKRNCSFRHDIANNPEFLREGSALNDFMFPDRIIVGCLKKSAARIMRNLYKPCLQDNDDILIMGLRESELSKYAANAMLATRISFINEIAIIAEKLDADIAQIQRGIGSDKRIGHHFLRPGCGYGGSCFPKDVRALVSIAHKHEIQPLLLTAVDQRNEAQKQVLLEKLEAIFDGDLSARRIAVLGLAFKPETDDLREAPAITLIHQLHQAGAVLSAHDPAANTGVRMLQHGGLLPAVGLDIHDDVYTALADADAMALVTEWPQFAALDFRKIRSLMRTPVIIDGRNFLDADVIRQMGFIYSGIGRKLQDSRSTSAGKMKVFPSWQPPKHLHAEG